MKSREYFHAYGESSPAIEINHYGKKEDNVSSFARIKRLRARPPPLRCGQSRGRLRSARQISSSGLDAVRAMANFIYRNLYGKRIIYGLCERRVYFCVVLETAPSSLSLSLSLFSLSRIARNEDLRDDSLVIELLTLQRANGAF